MPAPEKGSDFRFQRGIVRLHMVVFETWDPSTRLLFWLQITCIGTLFGNPLGFVHTAYRDKDMSRGALL